VVIEIPATGERLKVQLGEERFGPLCLGVEGARTIGYVLPSVLEIGWRIVATTAAERALLRTHGFKVSP
jgi:hypothetical protein